MSVDVEELKSAVRAVLDERDRIDHETHRVHHEYVAWLIECRRVKKQRGQEFVDRIRATVVGGLVLLVFSTVLAGLYHLGTFIIDLYQHRPPTP